MTRTGSLPVLTIDFSSFIVCFLFLCKQELHLLCIRIASLFETLHCFVVVHHFHNNPRHQISIHKHCHRQTLLKLYQINSLDHLQINRACLAFVFIIFIHRSGFQSPPVDCRVSEAYRRFIGALSTPLQLPQPLQWDGGIFLSIQTPPIAERSHF